MKILIKGGRVIDPANGIDDQRDVLIEDGKIAQVAKGIEGAGAEVINALGKVVAPGLIDLHVHLRDPGQEYKEDIISGTRAAASGGFTSVACMPNTNPFNDNKAVTFYIRHKADTEGFANVFPVASLTKCSKGETLSEMGDLKQAGAIGFSDDGRAVASGEVMRRAMEYARGFDMPVLSHAEDVSIVGDGVMNDSFVATELGLKGIPWVAEASAVARDVMLAEYTGARLHVCHISAKQTLDVIRDAKKRGVRVTCEVTPHHFSLTEEAVRGYDTNTKMSPPLRSSEDVAAMKQGLADGTIDAIATDHAPHHIDEKNVEFALAHNGIIGLETALPLTLRLVLEGVFSLGDAIARLTSGPARALNIPRGTLSQGSVADVVIIDTETEWTFEMSHIQSKSKNTPFVGSRFKGVAETTIRGGRIVYRRHG